MTDADLGLWSRRFTAAVPGRTRADHPLNPGADGIAGLAVAVKEVIATREAPVRGARPFPAGDATAVDRLRQAGAVIAGTTTGTELALGTPEERDGAPVPRNPWHTGHWAGGSSSGSAIAVAVGATWGALGTDTAGSIRVPAAYCGVTGLLPSYGRVPVTGALPLAFSLDRVGPMARSARDCALLLGVIAGHDPADPASSPRAVPNYLAALTGTLSGLRVGVCASPAGPAGDAAAADDPALAGALAAAAAALASLGARLTQVKLPCYRELTRASAVIMLSEALACHLPRLREDWAGFGRSARVTLATGALYSAADYVQAQRVRRAGRQALARLFATVDLVITPTARRVAPTVAEATAGGGGAWGDYGPICTAYWNMAGCPAVSVPMGIGTGGLPLGLQVAGQPFDEATVLRAADAYQQVTSWHRREPPARHHGEGSGQRGAE